MVLSFVVLDFAYGFSGCVLWLCVAVVCCGCVSVVVCCGFGCDCAFFIVRLYLCLWMCLWLSVCNCVFVFVVVCL